MVNLIHMSTLPVLMFLLICCVHCSPPDKSAENEGSKTTVTPTGYSSETITLTDDTTATVHIDKYVLITQPGKDRRQDAADILTVKRKWPLAMQSLQQADFENILADGFTFIADGKLMNRAEYIKNRTTPDDWIITDVIYENLTLQFFDTLAVLSYSNQVNNLNTQTKARETEQIHWVDMYTKENNTWKIAAAHVIAYAVIPTPSP